MLSIRESMHHRTLSGGVRSAKRVGDSTSERFKARVARLRFRIRVAIGTAISSTLIVRMEAPRTTG